MSDYLLKLAARADADKNPTLANDLRAYARKMMREARPAQATEIAPGRFVYNGPGAAPAAEAPSSAPAPTTPTSAPPAEPTAMPQVKRGLARGALAGGARRLYTGGLRTAASVGRVGGTALIAAGVGGTTLNVMGNRELMNSQDPPVSLLQDMGYAVERPRLGLAEIPAWFTGFGDPNAIGSGDPNYMVPASDVNELRVYTPEGEEISQGTLRREIDLLKQAGTRERLMRDLPARIARHQARARQEGL